MDLVQNQNDLSIKLDDLVEFFLNSQDVKYNSKQLYKRTLKQYFEWVNRKQYFLKDISRIHILQYKEDLLQSKKSSLTISSYITSVRKFYEWAEANKYYPNVAKGIKSPVRKQQFKKQPLTVEQANSLLDYYKNSIRDFAIINLILRTGLRTIEVIRLSIEDIAFKGNQRVLLVHGKGRVEKDNFVILTEKTYQPIKEYLSTVGNLIPSNPLFSSISNNSKGKRLSTRTISFIAKEGLKGIGLDEKSYSAHSLRHTTAINILNAGGSLEMAQFTLRHTNPATTQIYTASLDEERRLKSSGEVLIDSLF